MVDSGARHLDPLAIELAGPVHAAGVLVGRLEVLRLVGLVVRRRVGLLHRKLVARLAEAHDVGWQVLDAGEAGCRRALHERRDLAGLRERAGRELALAGVRHEMNRRRGGLVRLAREELTRLASDVRRGTRWDLTRLHVVRLLRLRLLARIDHTGHDGGLSDDTAGLDLCVTKGLARIATMKR